MSNFDIFKDKLKAGLDEDLRNNDRVTNALDEVYLNDKEEYDFRVSLLKECGYKVFRNSEGKHKIVAQ